MEPIENEQKSEVTGETALPDQGPILLLESPKGRRPSLLRDSIVLALILVLLGFFLFPFTPDASEEWKDSSKAAVSSSTENPFADLELQAKAAVVIDGATGEVLFEKNADLSLPLASLTKIMTAVTALSLAPEYTVIRLQPEFLRQEGDTGLLVDERWRLRDLLEFTLITSSNDGAAAAAAVTGAISEGSDDYISGRQAFIGKMNGKAFELGLTSMRFSNETGLDEDELSSGGYGTARDIAKLLVHAIKTHPFLFESTGEEKTSVFSLNEIEHTATNTNMAVNLIPMLIGSKTGFTDLAGGNLVIAFDVGPAHPVVVAVLGSTIDGRFEDATALSYAALEHFTAQAK